MAAKSVLRFESEFGQKLLSDGYTFTLGSLCVYSCAYCFVISVILKLAAIQAVKKAAALLGKTLEEIVVRRRKASKTLRRQLTVEKPAGVDLSKKAVVYTSPLVDPAATMVLVKETAAACRIIFELTAWDVRILSKSHLLPKLAELIPAEFKHRVIFGASTGTLDDALAQAVEKGAPPVGARFKSLHRVDDQGYRIFYMLCPILPQADYDEYARCLVAKMRLNRCEHVWASRLTSVATPLRRLSMH